MEIQQIIEQAKLNIRRAFDDYGAHASHTKALNDVSNEFIKI